MKLEQYLRETGESRRAFARRAQVQRTSLDAIDFGNDAVGETWARIRRATGGLVSRADYFPDSEALTPAP